MTEIPLTHHSGWPWPLDAVQDWFESLWETVNRWFQQVATWVWEKLPDPLKNFVEFLKDLTRSVWDAIIRFFRDPVGTLKGIFDGVVNFLQDVGSWITGQIWGWIEGALKWLTDVFKWLQTVITDAAGWIFNQISGIIGGVIQAITNFIETIWTGLQEIGTWISGAVSGFIQDLADFIEGGLEWLSGAISAAAEWLIANIGPAITWAVEAINNYTMKQLMPLTGATIGIAEILQNFGKAVDVPRLTGQIDGQISAYDGTYQSIFTSSSPKTPEDAASEAALWEGIVNTFHVWISGALMAAEAISLGQVDVTLMSLLNMPVLQNWFGTARKMAEARDEAGVLIPLRYYWLKQFTPMLPSPQDTIRFVVREVIPPEKFYEIMPYHGFSPEVAKWIWEAHWILPAPDHLIDAYHRKIISLPELDKFMVWHDYSPTARPGIAKSDVEIMRGRYKTLIPRVDIRRGWELGAISDEGIVERYEYLGYEDDAPLMAEIQKRVALDAEIGKIRDNRKADFVKGYIDESTLRADLAALGYGANVIEYHVADAVGDRERKRKDLLADFYGDAYVKDLISEDQARDFISEVIVVPEMVELEIGKRYVQKYRKPPPPKEEKVKVATLAYLTTAFREDIISEADLRAELERRLYSPDDIETIISVEIMKKMKAEGE